MRVGAQNFLNPIACQPNDPEETFEGVLTLKLGGQMLPEAESHTSAELHCRERDPRLLSAWPRVGPLLFPRPKSGAVLLIPHSSQSRVEFIVFPYTLPPVIFRISTALGKQALY